MENKMGEKTISELTEQASLGGFYSCIFGVYSKNGFLKWAL